MSEKRLALTSNGNIRYHLQAPYRDGTTDVIFDPAGAPAGRPSAAGSVNIYSHFFLRGAPVCHQATEYMAS